MSATVAIFGGTFDPVHVAHVEVARRALDALPGAGLVWLPTGNPGYRRPPVAAAADRLAMLGLAVAGEPRYRIDERELDPGHSGYTYDTVRELVAESPGTGFILLMGGDQYAKRETWHRWPDLAKLCRVAVIDRPGIKAAGGDAIRISMPPMAVSASDIRARVARGADISGLVPAAVGGYIRAHGLYR